MMSFYSIYSRVGVCLLTMKYLKIKNNTCNNDFTFLYIHFSVAQDRGEEDMDLTDQTHLLFASHQHNISYKQRMSYHDLINNDFKHN